MGVGGVKCGKRGKGGGAKEGIGSRSHPSGQEKVLVRYYFYNSDFWIICTFLCGPNLSMNTYK